MTVTPASSSGLQPGRSGLPARPVSARVEDRTQPPRRQVLLQAPGPQPRGTRHPGGKAVGGKPRSRRTGRGDGAGVAQPKPVQHRRCSGANHCSELALLPPRPATPPSCVRAWGHEHLENWAACGCRDAGPHPPPSAPGSWAGARLQSPGPEPCLRGRPLRGPHAIFQPPARPHTLLLAAGFSVILHTSPCARGSLRTVAGRPLRLRLQDSGL